MNLIFVHINNYTSKNHSSKGERLMTSGHSQKKRVILLMVDTLMDSSVQVFLLFFLFLINNMIMVKRPIRVLELPSFRNI
jgi:hypothetical protein